MDVKIFQIYKDTWAFDFPGLSVPFYHLNDRDIVLLDSGYEKTGRDISRYVNEHGLTVKAIINSHIHVDHIDGNASFLRALSKTEEEPLIFADMEELKETNHYHREIVKEGLDTSEETARAITVMDEMKKVMHDIGGLDSVSVSGARFDIIDAPGHSLNHKLITTPDGVCYVGDALMHGRILKHAKMPYAYDLEEDIRTKEEMRKLDYPMFVAAHEGAFEHQELGQIIDDNLTVYDNIFLHAKEISDADSEIKTTHLLQALGVRNHIESYWVRATAVQFLT